MIECLQHAELYIEASIKLKKCFKTVACGSLVAEKFQALCETVVNFSADSYNSKALLYKLQRLMTETPHMSNKIGTKVQRSIKF